MPIAKTIVRSNVNFRGEFETHFTLRTDDVESVIGWAKQTGMKLTHIVLSDGIHPSQPMLTRRSSGEFQTELKSTQVLTAELDALGAEVLGVKIEVDSRHAFAPSTQDDVARQSSSACYFEHHVKLLLPPKADLSLLQSVAFRHDARLSRNALQTREDGMQERFLTQRHCRTGRDAATKALMNLIQDLTGHSFHILETEAEYVVFDSNLELDSGWLPPP